MGAFSGFVRFGKGSLLGAALGAAAGVLFAPGAGAETRAAVADRIQRTRLAGADAKAATEQDLIHRFRGTVNDSAALNEEEAQSKSEHVERVAHVEATKPAF